ncbi:MAG: hypothetical protein B7Y45_02995 [Sphingomonas sp. 28-66-16]|nr:MAG: hypothetical protein B7Y45_02995 [Sphingomonas sp. 28-66-16]
MAEPLTLYNPRAQPVELHHQGAVVVIGPHGCLDHPRSGQVDRLIATGALRIVDRPAARPAEAAPDAEPPPETQAAPAAPPAGEATDAKPEAPPETGKPRKSLRLKRTSRPQR